MKQVLIRQGKAIVEQTPAPEVQPGCVLVQVHYSCISSGTEMSGIKMSAMPLWKRALKQPQHVKKVLQMVTQYGFSKTRSMVGGMLQAGQPTGYSAAGIVVAVGEGIEDMAIGNRVACAGAQCAHHAEVICVPRNLTTLVPDNLEFTAAATVTLGAIALQGVRRATPTLGETFVVIGLGVLGQLTAQLLKANGCRVIGLDVQSERLQLALRLGMDSALSAEYGDPIEQAARLTEGVGADGVIVTAATPSSEVIAQAFQICRKKGRVVLVGDVGLDIKRDDIYKKELDFFISTSYGPGRYDHHYEEQGLDYPLPYVRWTENRNMGEYLRQLETGAVKINDLISATYPISEATAAYNALDIEKKPLLLLLQYPLDENVLQQQTIHNPRARAHNDQQIALALIGAGGFAKGMHLPNLRSLGDQFQLRAVMSRSGHNALATAKQFNAHYATTHFQEILDDQAIKAIIIATRHDLHAELTLRALQAGKHVLIEKPLALNQQQLDHIQQFYAQFQTGKTAPLLLTGFNRRFSPFLTRITEITQQRNNPMIINYRMNAGFIAPDHWVHNAKEGGGRNIGEACHIYDLFTFLTNSQFTSVHAQSILPKTHYYRRDDNFVVTICFADGSVATLTYTALGNKNYPKEMLDIFVDGKVIALNDYRTLTCTGIKGRDFRTKTINKGQREELITFATAIKQGKESPIPLWQQMQAMQIAFAVQQQLTEPL